MLHPPTEKAARVIEIFSSLQGEGTCLGQRHIFVRFEECNIHCEYCDELGKPAIEMKIDEVLDKVQALENEEGPHSYVSLTGGEPLMYLSFIKPLIQKIKSMGLRIHLETGGILWSALKEVIDDCDIVAMDMKPASVTKEKNFDQDHEEFLKIAVQQDTFIKIIVSNEIDIVEFEKQVEIVERVAPRTPLLLVPISNELEGHEDPNLMDLLGRLQQMALKRLPDVRIVPRFHKILNIR